MARGERSAGRSIDVNGTSRALDFDPITEEPNALGGELELAARARPSRRRS